MKCGRRKGKEKHNGIRDDETKNSLYIQNKNSEKLRNKNTIKKSIFFKMILIKLKFTCR